MRTEANLAYPSASERTAKLFGKDSEVVPILFTLFKNICRKFNSCPSCPIFCKDENRLNCLNRTVVTKNMENAIFYIH